MKASITKEREEIMSNGNYRASKAMLRSIEKIEKKYGKFIKKYDIEAIEENRVGRGFYDFCDMKCPYTNMQFTVSHTGEIF